MTMTLKEDVSEAANDDEDYNSLPQDNQNQNWSMTSSSSRQYELDH